LSQTLLRDPSFHDFLEQADRDLAAKARRCGCRSCGGVVHSANYLRKPRGGPWRKAVRLSFCCAREGCRRRSTPPSLRFLGRRVYLGVIVVLMSALCHGVNQARLMQLQEFLSVNRRTLERWRQWWLRDFAESDFWKLLRGRFGVPVEPGQLPGSLVERFGGEERSRLIATLRSLAPITGGQGLAEHLTWWLLEIRRR
jgi:hypothetical protein